MGIQLSDGVKNIVGKEEIAGHKQFLLAHNVFKSCLLLMRQNEYLCSKGLSINSLEQDTILEFSSGNYLNLDQSKILLFG